jgi:PAS domain S-box-containing protein
MLARVSQILIFNNKTENELLSGVFGEVAAAMDAELCFNYQPHDHVSMRLCNWGRLTDEEQTLLETMRYGELLCERVAVTRKPIIVEDMAHTDAEGSEAVKAAGFGAYVGFPLRAEERFLGTVAFITRTKTHFIEGEVQIIQMVCDQLTATLERVRLERELRESEERLRLAAEATGFGTYDLKAIPGQTAWSRELYEITGLPVTETPDLNRCIHSEDRGAYEEMVIRALDGDGPGQHELEFRIQRSNGDVRWVRDTGRTFFDGEGPNRTPVRVVGTVQDITERKLVEHELKHARYTLSEAQKLAHVGSFEYVAATRTTLWSEEEYLIYGLDPNGPSPTYDEMLAKCIHPDDAALLHDTFSKALESRSVYDLEHRIIRPDGSVRWVCDRAKPYFDEQGSLLRYVGATLDITERKLAEQTLRESESRFRTMADGLPLIVWVHDATGYLEFVNETFCDYFGVTHEQMRNGEWLLLLHPEDADAYSSEFASCVREQRFFNAQVRVRNAQGQWRWLESWGRPRCSDSGEFFGFVGTSADITERKQSERRVRESERHLRGVLNSLSAFVGVMTPDGTLVQANEAALKAAGLAPEDVLGKPFDETYWWSYSPKVQARLREAIAQARAGQASRYDVKIRVADGNLIDIDFMLHPMIDEEGRVVHLIPSAIEVTDRKQAELALRETDQRKNEFLATLAHELRNPLATLRSGLEVMKLTQDDQKLIADTREMMERQFSHLVALVDDLLEISRISQGKLKLRSEIVSVSDVIQSAAETCRPLIDENGHSLTFDVPPQPIYVAGDSHRLVQLFANLINNAAKYTPRGGRIEVSAQPDGNEIVLSVKDSGIGIAADQISRVFELFAQVQKESSSYTGLGIGLSLVKSLVELHGGSITAQSAGHGAGSTFTVRLPVTQPKAESSQGNAVDSSPTISNGRRILVVDDNVGAARLLSIILKAIGHEVQTASNGQEAVERGRAFEPEIVFMDIGMPVMDGYQAARRIRSEAWGRGITLIALTGWGQDEDRQKACDAGFDRHLVKPVEPDTIRAILAELAVPD